MLREGIGESAIIAIWVLITFVFWSFTTIMRNSGGRNSSSSKHGFVSNSFRAVSSYMRVVSSGASSVAKSAASVAQSLVERDDVTNPDQVLWAGFDKLESEQGISRKVLLLGYRYGFQVWVVEEADNVFDLVSRHDGSVSFLQILPKPVMTNGSVDKFAENRPLLVLCGNVSGFNNAQDGTLTPRNGSIPSYRDTISDGFMPNVVRFFSLRSQSYVHEIKFRSVVCTIRCSSRVVAISQPNQIHCFNALTLEMEYTLVTNPISMGSPGSKTIGYGPLAVGPRWLAYSGSPVAINNTGCVSPQHLKTSVSVSSFTSNGNLVAHYAKESSKQLAAGIVTLGDIGYKKLSRYCSELLPDSHGSVQSTSYGDKGNGIANGHSLDAESVGMVVVRDIVSKRIISQFRAHKSPISALCFDPSGTLLVTASVQGHNINIFKIMHGSSSNGDSHASYSHLYRLQRGVTNAIIQDISFSEDCNWIMISSSKGTSHLFAINTLGGSRNFLTNDVDYMTKNTGLNLMTKGAGRSSSSTDLQMRNQHRVRASGQPVTLSAVSRIRNGYNGWRGSAAGAAAAATGRLGSFPGPIASSFHNSKAGIDSYVKYHLLVFTPSGSMVQYALRGLTAVDTTASSAQLSSSYESSPESDGRLLVEPIQKWNICHKQSRREQQDNIDIYGENGYMDSNKVFPANVNEGNIAQLHGPSGASQASFNLEEKHHLYISEAELLMHQACKPVWAKPEIYFQSMLTDRVMMNRENTVRGEIEIEWFPTRTIEVRSKNLIPVFDYLQTSKTKHPRVPAADCYCEGGLQRQQSGLSENGRLSSRSSSGSLDSIFNGGGRIAERQNGTGEVVSNGSRKVASVNINDSLETSTHTTGLPENGKVSCRSSSGSLDFMFNGGDTVDGRKNVIEEFTLNRTVGTPTGTFASVNIKEGPETDSLMTIS